MLGIRLALSVLLTFPQTAPNRPHAALPSDVSSIDSLVRALYDVVSGPAGIRNWDRMRSLFDPKAIVGGVTKGSDGQLGHVSWAVEHFIQMETPYFEKTPFYQREVNRIEHRYDCIADVFSTCEIRHKPSDENPFERGITSIQLYRSDGRWWILSTDFESDDIGVAVPKNYLPRAR